jgi:hypothetical protein
VIGDHVVGLNFFDGHLNGEIYLQFLQNELDNLIEHLPLNLLRDMTLMQDGCPAHFARPVHAYLNRTFRERWIGKEGPIPWSPRSPDLTPFLFDFSFV